LTVWAGKGAAERNKTAMKNALQRGAKSPRMLLVLKILSMTGPDDSSLASEHPFVQRSGRLKRFRTYPTREFFAA